MRSACKDINVYPDYNFRDLINDYCNIYIIIIFKQIIYIDII